MAVEYNNIGQSFMSTGDYVEALDAFERSMALLQAGETRRAFPEAMVTMAIAGSLMHLRRFDEAYATLEDARQRFLALGSDPTDERFRRIDRMRAGILREQGRVDEALAILEGQVDADMLPRQQRYNRTFLAFALLEAGRNAEALERLREAQAVYSWPEEHPEHIFLDGAIAYAEAASAGGDSAAAQEVLATSLAFFEDNGYGGKTMARQLRGWLAALDSSS